MSTMNSKTKASDKLKKSEKALQVAELDKQWKRLEGDVGDFDKAYSALVKQLIRPTPIMVATARACLSACSEFLVTVAKGMVAATVSVKASKDEAGAWEKLFEDPKKSPPKKSARSMESIMESMKSSKKKDNRP